MSITALSGSNLRSWTWRPLAMHQHTGSISMTMQRRWPFTWPGDRKTRRRTISVRGESASPTLIRSPKGSQESSLTESVGNWKVSVMGLRQQDALRWHNWRSSIKHPAINGIKTWNLVFKESSLSRNKTKALTHQCLLHATYSLISMEIINAFMLDFKISFHPQNGS